MIAVLDLGIGNLSSVCSAFARTGEDTVVLSNAAQYEALVGDPGRALRGLVLPGVGAFGDAMFQLRTSGLQGVIRKAVRDGTPALGICLGMQLLFSLSEEYGSHVGLGVIPGRIVRFANTAKVPHMGWNDLSLVAAHPLLAGVAKGDYVYFVHSYYAVVQDEGLVIAAAEYGGVTVPAVVARDNVYGAQFHPEKSGDVGERILRNFVQICRRAESNKGAPAHV